MRSCLLVLLAATVLGPAAALAASGPSAGDNQYTDPLKSTTTTASKPAKSASTTTPAATPPPSTSSGTINTAPPVATATTTAPTATIATTASSATSTSATLPRTGYDSWLAAALGAGLVAAGLSVRRRVANR
jgi:LPXTG-motif cell wall-anchored protein